MISHKHKFIFIHIPKCGGTSVEQTLLKNEGIPEERILKWNLTHDEQQKFRLWYKYGNVDVQHRKIDQYKTENEKKYFTFTFVRNPWERFLSEYFYIKKLYSDIFYLRLRKIMLAETNFFRLLHGIGHALDVKQ